jgi:hypothetical protein
MGPLNSYVTGVVDRGGSWGNCQAVELHLVRHGVNCPRLVAAAAELLWGNSTIKILEMALQAMPHGTVGR